MAHKILNYRPNVIDVEASGIGNGSYPIEVGVVLSCGSNYCSLIKPDPDWNHWDEQAELVHGISRDKLFMYGKPVKVVAAELNQFLSEKTVYSDGWVVDKPWLSELFFKSGLKPRFFVSALEMILREEQMQLWSPTKEKVIVDMALTRHRASADALIIQETYARTCELCLIAIARKTR